MRKGHARKMLNICVTACRDVLNCGKIDLVGLKGIAQSL
jgi:hypothetical protein